MVKLFSLLSFVDSLHNITQGVGFLSVSLPWPRNLDSEVKLHGFKSCLLTELGKMF